MGGMDQFKDLWVQTARERIQSLSDLLLKLEKNPTELDIINELMRMGHSLKGESAAMGYEQIATLAHVIEDLFTGMGKGEISISSDIMDQLLAALDIITQSVDGIEANNQESDTKEVVDKLKALTGLKTEGFGKTDKAKPLTSDGSPSSETASQNQGAEQNKVDSSAQQSQETNQSSMASEQEPASVSSQSEQPKADQTAAVKTQTASAGVPEKAKQVSTVTMKIEKLDQLLSVNEELVLLKMKLKNHDIVEGNADLKADIHKLDRLVTDMQFYLMQARLFPISLALQTVPRLVRDTARKTEKSVRLEVEGDDTTVDRTIIDHLSEAFVHMIRNSVDHGIESPEKRREVGKPEEGVIKIKSYTKENKFFTEISDDGAGIEWDKLVRKAIEKGLFTKEETERWTDKDKEQLLYLDGVSASDQVSDVSGRGVGLGAVRQAIKKLGGNISVTSEVGKGTTFTLKMPMTLAIMQALLVNVGDQTFAMPSHEVVRSIQINSDQLQFSGNVPAIVVDKSHVYITDLADVFKIKPKLTSEAEDSNNSSSLTAHKTIVLVKQDEEIMGCLVDKIVAEEEILVKPLITLLKQSNYFSGVTILADGSAAPIINLEGIKWKQTHN